MERRLTQKKKKNNENNKDYRKCLFLLILINLQLLINVHPTGDAHIVIKQII